MEKMLTGIRSTGTPHLGNILGVIIPSIYMANKNKKHSSFIFIADLHSMVQIDNIKTIQNNTYQIAAAWLAFGLNTDNCLFYRQSDVSLVTELAWYFSCFYPYQRLTLAHAFKKKEIEDKGKISVGLFAYPILMAADILLYNAKIIPVGKDQLQHIEIARRIANYFNKKIGEKLFVLPNAFLQKQNMFVIGTDGKKMSKSQKNYINIFSSDEILKKQIMSIRTDSKSVKENKDPVTDNIISLYSLIATVNEIDMMKKRYIKGGYGYHEAKIALYEYIIHKFSLERKRFFSFMKNKSLLDHILALGAKKAKRIAYERLNYIRKHLKLNSII
ncbi:tryptophan--tRNA ligase [Blattabacterium sp. DPU]|uniref:tryptophan--tRNA ligase n=1 Tax=Blattabacterium sp. DPU TaxID=2715232 RepID=UPI00140798DF|nr:tryptophan--tRNA ligase [Blattabacterium sp. DPU]QIK16889.1 tryptophan--tRNA ligase [Blattabacterium sp. DPU]